MDESVFGAAVLLAYVVKGLVDYLAAPIRQKHPEHDLWYLVYVALAFGGVVGWLAGINLFGKIETMPVLVGRILTAACIGAGANFLHDIAKRRADRLPPLYDDNVPEM